MMQSKMLCDADETTADDGDDSNADTDVETYEEASVGE
jgi:hypothetical protein